MKCVIHIGTEKTGSTSIQQFMHQNRIKLYGQGVIFTQCAGKANNHGVCFIAEHPGKNDDVTRVWGSGLKGVKYDRAKRKCASRLKGEIKRKIKHKKDPTLVISSEHIQSRLDKEELKNLKAFLVNVGVSEFKIVVYLRDPVGTAQSLYSTVLKVGRTYSMPHPDDQPYYKNVCDHKATIERFESVFGRGTVVPRIFERDELVNCSVVDDFLSLIGITNTNKFKQAVIKNESLSPTGAILLKHLNHRILREIDGVLNPKRHLLISAFEEFFSTGKYEMPIEIKKAYEEMFLSSNEWVRLRYFPDRTSLFRSSKSRPEVSEINMEEIADFIAMLWDEYHTLHLRRVMHYHYHKQMKRLKKRLGYAVR